MYKLRELEKKDLPSINLWRNNIELISNLGAPFRFINEEVDNKWYESYMNSRSNTVRCAIVTDSSDDILGLVSLVKIDYMNQSAEFHIMIGNQKNRSKGAGTFATREMIRHAFYNLNLQRIELYVLPDNYIAQHVYEKVGFIKEGIKRSARFKNGVFVDLLQYSLLRNEFQDREILGEMHDN